MRSIVSRSFGLWIGLAVLFVFRQGPGFFAQEGPLEKSSSREMVEDRFAGQVPKEWGEAVLGVKTRLVTREKVIALTLDACGSERDGYDEKLISFLRKEKIPAVLFINARWIDKNPLAFQDLAQDPLFQIGNHGFWHRPASVNGKSVYGIQGTKNLRELTDEIESGALKIKSLTGKKPKYFRSGTAYYDEIAVQVAHLLGYEVIGYSVLGDRGATATREEVQDALLDVHGGEIVILHMNHPEKDTAEGVMAAIPELRKRGYRFVRLSA